MTDKASLALDQVTQQCCGTCRFWDHWDRATGMQAFYQKGQCRRHAPILQPLVSTSSWHEPTGSYPHTVPKDWCGDWTALTQEDVTREAAE